MPFIDYMKNILNSPTYTRKSVHYEKIKTGKDILTILSNQRNKFENIVLINPIIYSR